MIPPFKLGQRCRPSQGHSRHKYCLRRPAQYCVDVLKLVVHIHVQHAGIAGVTDCAQHDVQRIERKNTFLPSRLCSALIAELRDRMFGALISTLPPLPPWLPPLTSIWLPAASLKLFSDSASHRRQHWQQANCHLWRRFGNPHPASVDRKQPVR